MIIFLRFLSTNTSFFSNSFFYMDNFTHSHESKHHQMCITPKRIYMSKFFIYHPDFHKAPFFLQNSLAAKYHLNLLVLKKKWALFISCLVNIYPFYQQFVFWFIMWYYQGSCSEHCLSYKMLTYYFLSLKN